MYEVNTYQGKSHRKHFLDWWIKKHNISFMVEVGVRDGRTTFHLLDKNPNLQIIAIDKSIKLFYNNEIRNKYGDRLKPIEAYSDFASTKILDNSQELIFIDANHSYEWVKKDIMCYRPKLKKDGWLTGHDIDYAGVKKAVDETINYYETGPNNVWLTKITT
jgi:hypothetical protein